jgi:hypothetical protein
MNASSQTSGVSQAELHLIGLYSGRTREPSVSTCRVA